MPATRLQQLFQKYLDDSLQPEELAELTGLMQDSYDPKELDGLLEATLANPAYADATGVEQKKEVVASLLARMDTPVVPLRRQRWRWVAAAAIVFLVAGVFYWQSQKPMRQQPPVVANKPQPSYDVLPGKSGAILTLGNGEQVALDDAQNGRLARQGNTQLTKQEGRLSYRADKSGAAGAAVLYNTVSTPRGRQFQLVLSDGTAVWLNAASSIRFPTAFTGNERRVEITGEAYFEVRHNAAIPFRVHIMSAGGKDAGLIEDIGTAFNVNAYADEPVIKTTLVEGSVRVSRQSAPDFRLPTSDSRLPTPDSRLPTPDSRLLTPGQQAVMTSERLSVSAANIPQALAWKNGFFSFDRADINTVMRQLARWYDVEVQYEGRPDNTPFHGKIGRDLTLAQVLKGLEQVHVHFRIEQDKRIVILP